MSVKVSVIIPCYNAEKYIRQCLISILSSKFADYEVIVADDCSTDKSVEEVEKLLPHFDGRLKIISTEKNSGGAGVPRNLGIKSAAGKYITFVDNDDMLVPTALGNFFEVAEKFSADVVHTEKNFIFEGEQFQRENLKLQSDEPHDSLVEEVTPETNNLQERIARYVEGKFFWLPWGKLYRRDFLLSNEIYFPQIKFSEDMLFCFKCMCLAENYIRVPFVANIHRMRKNSVSKNSVESDEGTADWLKVILNILEEIEIFLNKIHEQKYFCQVTKFFIDTHFKFIKNLFTGLSTDDINKIFLEELSRIEKFPRGKNILLAYLCTNKFLNWR